MAPRTICPFKILNKPLQIIKMMYCCFQFNHLILGKGQICHVCVTKNADGTNKIIGPGEKCLVPLGKCFWEDLQDIENCGVKTRSCTKKEPPVSIKPYRNYFEQKE